MRRILLAIGLLLTFFWSPLAQEKVAVHDSVSAYLQTLLEEQVDTIIARVDRLIDSVGTQQPDLQSKVAGIAFDYFTQSPVMGHEAVAVHIADDWFLNDKLKMENENLYPVLYTYAEFNRSSLIGKPAPSLVMEDIEGNMQEIRSSPASYKILFFYDTECSTCRKEAPVLAELMRNYSGEPLTLYAVYTQADRQAWEKYVSETFSRIENPSVTVVHLWDPEAATGFHKKYAVLSTPMLFLLDGQNIITGRGLDCEALAQLLNLDNSQILQFKHLFDQVFSAFEPLSFENVESIIEAFHERTEPDPALHKETMLNLFNYLRSSDVLAKQQGAIHLAEKYIAADPDSWSPEFYERIVHALAQARLNPVGTRATDLRLQNKRGRTVNLLDNKHFATILFFHLIDCRQCAQEFEELKRIRAALYDMDIKVVMIYVGHEQEKWRKFVRKQWPSHWKYINDFKGTSGMRQRYDLEYVPHLYLLDENGIIIAKDIRVSELKDILIQL